jgi:hypothetical protein
VVRHYCRVVGPFLVLLGIAGLLAGDQPLFGELGLNSDFPEDLLHLLTGGLLAGVGFRGTDALVRSAAGGVGVVYVLLGVLGAVNDELFGLLPDGYTVVDNLLHLVLGGLGIALAWVVGRREEATG